MTITDSQMDNKIDDSQLRDFSFPHSMLYKNVMKDDNNAEI